MTRKQKRKKISANQPFSSPLFFKSDSELVELERRQQADKQYFDYIRSRRRKGKSY